MSFKEYHDFVSHIGVLILILNLIVFIISYSVRGVAYKYFCQYLGAMTIIQIVIFFHWLHSIHNVYLAHFYFIFQFIFLSLFYYHLFETEKQKWLVKILLFTVLLSLGIQYVLYPNIFWKFNLLEIILTSLSLVLYSIVHFYNSLSGKIKFAYVNAGVFMYLLSSMLIFSSGNIMPDLSEDVNAVVWFLNVVLYLIYQLLITVEWFLNFRKKPIIIK